MHSKQLAKYSLLFLVILFYSGTVIAQRVSKTGTTAASFLEIGVGANAVAMGGAFVSIANNASALYWNASGIANISQNEVLVMHTNWIAQTSFDYAALVLPLGTFGNLGFSFTSLSMEDMKVRTVDQPEGTGEYFSAGDLAVGISYARNLTDRFSIGFSAKFIQQKIWHMSSTGFAFDASTLFHTDLFGGMVIGASISNFGTPMQLVGRDNRQYISVDNTQLGSNDRIPSGIEMDSWDLPLIFQIGISTKAINTQDYKLTVAFDAIHPNNDFESMNVGTEFSFKDFLFIRGGYQSLFLKDSEGGLTLGIGVNTKMLFSNTNISFDYAYRDFGRLEGLHTFSIDLKF
ncbi:MAG: PorV/PorQ family protein [Ignavibacteriales bacterium]|nr:PorV/PorQ family protein [Ignavibacteriales bacterium]